METCSAPDCNQPRYSKGMCQKHYNADYHYRRRQGQPRQRLRDGAAKTYTLEERLWAYSTVEVTGYETECWIHHGTLRGKYPALRWQGQMISAHLVAYTELVRTPASDEQVHHLCRVKRCWRPDHLVALDPTAHRRAHFGGPADGLCTECGLPVKAKGLCRKHYLRQWRES